MKRFYGAILLLCAFMSGCGPVVSAGRILPDRRDVPVLMYHGVLKDPARACKYIVSPDVLRDDIAWLQAHGYETVTGSDLISFVAGTGTLPEKPVMLTFDDGYLNNLTYVLPLLERYDCRALISVVGEYTASFSDQADPNPNYAYLTWDDVAALAKSGRVEIGNHTYALHGENGRKGSAHKPGESEEEYETIFLDDVGRLQSELSRRSGVTPLTFAYPFGVIDPLSRSLLDELGFIITLSCNERVSTVVCGQPDTLLEMGRFNRKSGISTEAFMKKIFQE